MCHARAQGGKETNTGVRCFGRGEVTYRGNANMSGYYKNPAATAETIDADGCVVVCTRRLHHEATWCVGYSLSLSLCVCFISYSWIHSGDIAIWDERGGLKIVDRKKALFKLAQVS